MYVSWRSKASSRGCDGAISGTFRHSERSAASPPRMHKKMILAGLDCERGVWWPGPQGGLRRARFFLLFLLSFAL